MSTSACLDSWYLLVLSPSASRMRSRLPMFGYPRPLPAPPGPLGGRHLHPPPPVAAGLGDQAICVDGHLEQPRHHDIRVRVVVDPLAGTIGVSVVEFIGTHHTANVISVIGGVVLGDADEKAGNGHQHLGAVRGEKVDVGGHLVVLPDVVGHRQADMTLPAGVVRHPTLRVFVPQLYRRLLAAVAPALPRVHGALVSGELRGMAGWAQTPGAGEEQGAGEGGGG